MVSTLSVDDEDSVAVVVAVERAFDIAIENKEAESILTVGEMFDLLLRKIAPGDDTGKCASAMAFYRVRRALFPGASELSPSYGLSALREIYTKRFAQDLKRKTGLRFAPAVPDLARQDRLRVFFRRSPVLPRAVHRLALRPFRTVPASRGLARERRNGVIRGRFGNWDAAVLDRSRRTASEVRDPGQVC